MGTTKADSKALFKCMVKNKTDTSADLYFYGDIVPDKGYKWSNDDKCPADVVEALDSIGDVDTLNIYINSGGGSVFAGNAIFNRLKAHSAHKVVHIDGVAASIASVIALAGDEIIMPVNSYLMIHKAWTLAMGNSDELRAEADRLEQIEESIVATYVACSTDDVTEEKIKDLMAAETWLSPAEAAELFTAVTVSEDMQAAACISEMKYMQAPNGAIIAPSTEQNTTKPGSQKHEPQICGLCMDWRLGGDCKNCENNPHGEDNDTEKAANENRLKILDSFIFTEGEHENE